MASSGVRVGALPHMRLRDLEPNDTYGIYKIIAYPKSKKSRYFTFCTPECRVAIDTYLDWRKRFGERLEPDSPLFRCSFNAEGVNVRNPHAITRSVIIKAITQLLKHCGIRPHLTLESESRKHHRYDIMGSHGLRKFWETQAYRAGMDVQYMRRLLGQKGGNHVLEDAYLKLEDNELLEGDSKHVGFIGIIDALTIDETHRLQKKIQKLEIEVSKVDGYIARLAEMEKRMEKQIGLQE
jgi:integrase